MKALKPSLRVRRRYIAFEILTENEVSRRDLQAELWSSTSSLLGDVGSSILDLWLLGFDGRLGIVRCRHDRVDEARAAMATVDRIDENRVAIRVLGVSGTVRGATKKFIEPRNVQQVEGEENRLEYISTNLVSGNVFRRIGVEIDVRPDSEDPLRRAQVKSVGITVFDLGDDVDAYGTSDGL